MRRIACLAALCAAHASLAAPGTPRGAPVTFTAVPLELSASGPDQLQSIVAGPDGSFFAAGFIALIVGGERVVFVARITPQFTLDPDFGSGGVALTSMVPAGGNDEIDLVLQDGRPVVSATVASDTILGDRDIAMTRLTETGSIDTGFGDGGEIRIDLNTGYFNGTSFAATDASRALAVGPDGSLYLHAMQRAEGTAIGGGPRTDTDFVVMRRTMNGLPVPGYGNGGKRVLDIEEANATPRALAVLADGSVLASGYANTPSVNSVQPVLYRLTPSGDLDPAFANTGVFHEAVIGQTEIYGLALHGGSIVTSGYGNVAGEPNDFVSLRFDADGERDTGWGGAPGGVVMVDPSGDAVGDNARAALALPGGRTVLIGSAGPGNMPSQDAALVFLDANGGLDPLFGAGTATFAFGSDGNDQLWSGAYNRGRMVFAGYKGGGSMQTATVNDDAWLVVATVPALEVVFADDFEAL